MTYITSKQHLAYTNCCQCYKRFTGEINKEMNICRTVEREREDKRIREGGRDARVRKREGGSE